MIKFLIENIELDLVVEGKTQLGQNCSVWFRWVSTDLFQAELCLLKLRSLKDYTVSF